jgi:chemotaxis protein MotB
VSADGQIPTRVIRVTRRRRVRHPHHGGSWKIAYADFVTAMMAFFMVLWILGMSPEVRKAIQAYFTDPIGYQKAYSQGASPISSGSSPTTVPRPPLRMITRASQERAFLTTAERLRHQLAAAIDEKGLGLSVDVLVDKAGLRIDLFESGRGDAAFPLGSAEMKPAARRALLVIAGELRGLPNDLVVEGHTDATQFPQPGYSNWELSSDRANAARRVLEGAEIPARRVIGVRGLADRDPRLPAKPFDPSNRRITILLPFQSEAGMVVPPIAHDAATLESRLGATSS